MKMDGSCTICSKNVSSGLKVRKEKYSSKGKPDVCIGEGSATKKINKKEPRPTPATVMRDS